MLEKIKTINLLDLDKTIAYHLLLKYKYAYETLAEIKGYTIYMGNYLSLKNYDLVKENVWISKTANVYDTATIEGPVIIGDETEVRPGAWIRGNAIIGKNCVIGNSTEIKNSILFDNVQVPHFNYVGDSILGYKAHFEAGTITSNQKSDKSNITIKIDDNVIFTNLRKFGAIVGDYVEIGCNAVLNPGTIIGRNTTIYPLTSVEGFIEEDSILKLSQEQDLVKKLKLIKK